MGDWSLGNLSVIVQLGNINDSNIGLAVKTKDIRIGRKGPHITVQEGSNAEETIYWPSIALENPDRRSAIYAAASAALETAAALKAEKVGFFTMGFEVSRIPSWEVAEEIVKAIVNHSKTTSGLNSVFLVASSPIQVSSFQYALNNIATIVSQRPTS
ncbi:MAG: hypothetical protein ACFFBL_03885 [Promethearchaeota archaeon]